MRYLCRRQAGLHQELHLYAERPDHGGAFDYRADLQRGNRGHCRAVWRLCAHAQHAPGFHHRHRRRAVRSRPTARRWAVRSTTSSFTRHAEYGRQQYPDCQRDRFRGRVTTTTRTISVLDYAQPSLTKFTAERCSNAGTAPQMDGTRVRVSVGGSVSPVGTKNTIACVVYYRTSGAKRVDTGRDDHPPATASTPLTCCCPRPSMR